MQDRYQTPEKDAPMIVRGTAEDRHIPVLRDRIVELLAPALQETGAVMVDATVGMGGHSEAILERCPGARVVGIDRDLEALSLAGDRLARFGDRFTAVHAVYDELPQILTDLGLTGLSARASVSAVLLDLGVSSLQLDEEERGFAYRHDAPLDMRMDQGSGVTAAHVLNTYDQADLERILREYGEERFAKRVVSARRALAGPATLHQLGTAGRAPSLGDSCRFAEERWTPGQTHLPSVADRGQRRARSSQGRASGSGSTH